MSQTRKTGRSYGNLFEIEGDANVTRRCHELLIVKKHFRRKYFSSLEALLKTAEAILRDLFKKSDFLHVLEVWKNVGHVHCTKYELLWNVPLKCRRWMRICCYKKYDHSLFNSPRKLMKCTICIFFNCILV